MNVSNIAVSEQASNTGVLRLKLMYTRYGASIYTLCLRLLADEKAAESATVDTFVQFGKELL